MSDVTLEITASKFAELVRSVMPLAGTDRMIPILNTVRIESRGLYLTASATDRFRLGISRVPLDPAPPAGIDFLIRLSELRQILAIFKPTRDVDPTLTLTLVAGDQGEVGPDRLRVTQSGGFSFIDASMTFGLERGDFPKLGPILAKYADDSKEPTLHTGMNPTYLADFRHVTRDRHEPIVVHSSGLGHPTIITAGDYFIGALMPVRVHDELGAPAIAEWTDFLADPKPAKPARKSSAKATKRSEVAA